MKKLLFVVLFISQTAFAQEVNRYMVFFKDKQGSSFSIDRPQEFLTERAIARRKQYDIPVTLQDLPVNFDYIQQVQAAGVAVFYRSRWLNAVLVEDQPDKVEALTTLAFVEKVEYIAPGVRLNARKSTNSTKQQSTVPQTQLELLDVPLLHEQGYTGAGKMVAVFDDGFIGVNTGELFDHLYRNDQIEQVWDFVANSADVYRYDDHGTKSFSTIAAVDSGTFIGVAPNAQFLLAVTEDVATEYIIEEYNWLIAAEWADSLGTDIITSSLGYTQFDDASMNHIKADLDGKTTVAARAANWATERGILVVSSAGNNRSSAWETVSTPADALSILAVGAINAEGTLAYFSSGGPTADGRIKPDVVALGQGTVVVRGQGDFVQNSGTSFSAPQIAGFAAAVWEAYPTLSNLELRELIIRAGDRFDTPDNEYGYGLPSFSRVANLALAIDDRVHASTFALYPNPVGTNQQWLTLDLKEETPMSLQVQVIDGMGRQVLLFRPLTSSQELQLNVSALTPGLYLIYIQTEKGSSLQKLIRL